MTPDILNAIQEIEIICHLYTVSSFYDKAKSLLEVQNVEIKRQPDE